MHSECPSLAHQQGVRIGGLNIILSIGGARAGLGMLEIPMSQKGYKERSQSRRSLFSCQHGIIWTGEESSIFSSAFRFISRFALA